MDKKSIKPICCEDVKKILEALKGGDLNEEELRLLKEHVFKKMSLHIASCRKCFLLAEELGFGLPTEAWDK